MNPLEKTLNEIKSHFRSVDFRKAAIKNGATEFGTIDHRLRKYLNQHCIKLDSSSFWHKKVPKLGTVFNSEESMLLAIDSILEATLSKMDNQFSSRPFIRTADKLGLNRFKLPESKRIDWLNKNCERIGRRTWNKKTNTQTTQHQTELLPIKENNNYFNEVEDAIIFLKSKGYKILEPIKDWKEV